jgi:hypothetical protein
LPINISVLAFRIAGVLVTFQIMQFHDFRRS